MGEQRAENRAIIRLIYLPGQSGDEQTEEELCGWDTETWSRLLRTLPIEANTFALEWNDSWDAVIERLHDWCRRFHDRPSTYRRRYRAVFGQLGLLLVTLVSLRHSYQYRYVTDVIEQHHDCASICAAMLEEPAVRKAIAAQYAPAELGRNHPVRKEWNRVEVDSLRFHRSGTTSFILVGRSTTAEQGTRRSFALKCILLPYAEVDAIAKATTNYLTDFGRFEAGSRHLVKVWASCSRWIMMDYVAGATLAEYLSEQAPSPGQRGRAGLRVDLLRRLGPQLFEALGELDGNGLHHGDLSPSNIIVQDPDDPGPSLVLIDLGVNHLHSRAISGSGGPDARYVAPETRDSGLTSERGDLYALGFLLVTIGLAGSGQANTGSVPDEFYAESAVFARFIEDLTDRDPARRLLVFRPDHQQPLFPQLAEYFDDELGALEVAQDIRSERVQNLLTPLSGGPRRAWRVWKHRRGRPLYRDRRRGMHLRWLLFWSWLTAVGWYGGSLIVLVWCLRDLGLEWGNLPISFLQSAFDASEADFPILDAFRADNYPTNFTETFPARIVAFSSMLLAIRHGQHVLAGITPLIATGERLGLSVHARATDIAMRTWPLAAVLCAMVPTLVHPRWWPVALAAGVLCGLLSNIGCWSLARAVFTRAARQGMTTASPGEVPGLRRLWTWTVTNAFYALTVLIIGTLLVLDRIDDELVYAVLVCGVHLDTYIRSASGESARSVRVALARACLTGERLQELARSGDGTAGKR